jgi:DNA replication protein DnaC
MVSGLWALCCWLGVSAKPPNAGYRTSGDPAGPSRVVRETHALLDDLAETVAEGTRKEFMESLTTVPLLIINDFGMRKLPIAAAEDLLEIVIHGDEQASTLLTSNSPVEDGGKLLGDVAGVSAMLDRLLHHGHVLNCGPRSWRTKTAADSRE